MGIYTVGPLIGESLSLSLSVPFSVLLSFFFSQGAIHEDTKKRKVPPSALSSAAFCLKPLAGAGRSGSSSSLPSSLSGSPKSFPKKPTRASLLIAKLSVFAKN